MVNFLDDVNMKLDNLNIAVIGLGYVGLPLAVEFGKIRPVIGFDIDVKRISDLKVGSDLTLKIDEQELIDAKNLRYTTEIDDLKSCNCFIVTVPTPIDNHNKPDLTPLIKASETVGKVLKIGDIVIYESTVYPGCTEEDCVPILEKVSKLKFNQDFYCGYSPERINPGDKEHRVSTIKKITSGSTPEIADIVDQLYNEIVTVGTHRAETIKVAEAAKVIENIQRDVNIALINELTIIFNKMQIDTEAVLKAFERATLSKLPKHVKEDYDAENLLYTQVSQFTAERVAEGRAEGEAKGRAEGEAKGEAKGRAEGEAKGRAEGSAEALLKAARAMKELTTLSNRAIASQLQLSESQVANINIAPK